MGAADRTVQRLHLRAPSAQAATRAVHRLEDALRCASLPDVGERVLLVRRLHLGRLPADLSSQSLSLLIEQRVAAVGGAWVHGAEERAAFSDTVLFEGRWQAASTALDRRARGLPLSAWYWRAALPGVPLEADPQAFVHGLWLCLEREEAAPASHAALVADAVVRRHGDWLVNHLANTVGPDRGVAPVQASIELASDVTDAEDLVHYSHPHRIGVPRAWPPALHAHLRAAGWRAEPPRAMRPVGMPPRTAPPRAVGQVEAEGPQGHIVMAEDGASSAPTAAGAVKVPASASAPLQGLAEPAVATSVGGLLFLLPVLGGLGFGAWQAQHTDLPLCSPILRRALQHLRVAETDPAWELVDSLPSAAELAQDGLLAAWLDACRRQLYRAERLSLARLCRRPARLRWTATHLDVQLDLRHADIRVRRQGFDLNPGWLPWLGRVVSFSYEQVDALP